MKPLSPLQIERALGHPHPDHRLWDVFLDGHQPRLKADAVCAIASIGLCTPDDVRRCFDTLIQQGALSGHGALGHFLIRQSHPG